MPPPTMAGTAQNTRIPSLRATSMGVISCWNFACVNSNREPSKAKTGRSALHDHGHAHAAADAHADQARAVSLASHVVHGGDHLTGPGGADRVPEGNAAADLVRPVVLQP